MSSSSADDDELLLILLKNLQNATSTLGPSHESVQSIRSTLREHLVDMQSRGVLTNLARTKEVRQVLEREGEREGEQQRQPQQQQAGAGVGFGRLAFRPKPS